MPDAFTPQDESHMRRALELAARGRGRVEPNPMVGCVLAKRNRIIGQGYHRRFGQAHAEVNALRSCTQSPRGATAYVTLEPCSHFGKTPPCAEALIEAGITGVVAAVKDEGPFVDGRGFRKLRRAGLKVRIGCLAEQARILNAPYLTRLHARRPFVILKWAQSLDGRLVTPPGHPPDISGSSAHQWVHRLRARVDAVCVGIETALADDPLLTARGVPLRRLATRVVFDSRLRLRPTSRLVRSVSESPLTVFCARRHIRANPRRADRLRSLGVEVVPLPTRGRSLDLRAALRRMYDQDMTNVLVEGGPAVLSAFLKAGLADQVHVFVAPTVIGGGPGQVVFASTVQADRSAPEIVSVRRIGPDLHYTLRFHRHPR